MRISITYLYTIFTYGYPPKIEDEFKALADIEKMGFHYLEMEGLGGAHTEAVWTRRHELKKALDDHGIHVHNFCGVDPELVSVEDDIRLAACERFKRTAELGAFFGAETLHLASYAPPIQYLGDAPYKLGEKYSFASVPRVRIPDGFLWQRVWNALIDSCRRTSAVAQEFGRTIIMEPRVGEVVCSVDSQLRLIQSVGAANFKANFDTGHFSAQRENVALALMKLEGRFANIHLSDNDPATTDHLPVGEGKIDWPEFFRVLARQNYTGYIGLDLGGRPTLKEDLRKSRDAVAALAQASGMVVEY